MTRPAIKVEGLWKEYVIGAQQKAHGTLYDMLSSSLAAPFRALRKRTAAQQQAESFWALRDINFEVQPGEVVGIIGRNGAGKSTLLKILSRITAPTRGRVEVRGRLASLLEVGTGFHPELSGRENIYLNGAILGMTRAEVARKFDEIVAFAEVEKFIDTPVKRYSSGMYVRLAYAVAAHLESDVLIVDEVLAVGDAEFQQKCIGQMATMSQAGKTVIVVSHNMQIVKKICRVSLLLEKGNLIAAGSVEDVQFQYLDTGGSAARWVPTSADSEVFQYSQIQIVPPAGYASDAIPSDRPIDVEFRFSLSIGVTGRLAMAVRNQYDIVVFTSSDTDGEAFVNKRWHAGTYVETCTIPARLLVPGRYKLTVSRPLVEGNQIISDICSFTVDRAGSLVERDLREGVVSPLLKWHAETVE